MFFIETRLKQDGGDGVRKDVHFDSCFEIPRKNKAGGLLFL